MSVATPVRPAHVERLRAYMGARYAKSTIRAFCRQSEAFIKVAGVKPVYSREDVMRFIDVLIGQKYKARSIGTILAGVQALFRALGQPWPLDKADMHLGLPLDENTGPTLAAMEVAAMIAAARQMAYPALQITALATVYGFRNAELADIMTLGCDGKRLEVQTAKNGRKRVHAIPPCLSAILTIQGRTMQSLTAHRAFDAVMGEVRPPAHNEGWHAVRRALATGLVKAKLHPYTLHHFMGWKLRETGYGYDRPEAGDVDRDVYALHPFLRHWEAGGGR